MPDRERALQEEAQLSQSDGKPKTTGDERATRRRDSQSKQRLLQTGAADDDIPQGVAQRLHVCYMGLARSHSQDCPAQLGFAGAIEERFAWDFERCRQRKFEEMEMDRGGALSARARRALKSASADLWFR